MGKGLRNAHRFTRVSLDDVLRADADGMPVFRKCFEHEVMMSFYDDEGADSFKEWWESRGAIQFGDWCAKNDRLRLL